MAIPLATLITKRAFRGMMQPFVRKSISEGISGREMLRIMTRTYSRAYRQASLYSDIRYWKSVGSKSGILASTQGRPLPLRRSISISKGLQSSTWRYQVKMVFVDPKTGQSKTLFTNVATNRPVSQDTAEFIARDLFKDAQVGYESVFKSAQVTGIFIRDRRSLRSLPR